ncbi:MAG: TetR/AcrR family transcriptional regulator [Saprospiraceae bacterium]|nr:TetR/AcrR family transcriptional regulator [Saprospiraceae bacterium]
MQLKDTLWTSALELFLKYGIKSVSMDDLAKSLGISKKTIYTCIVNKEDLILKVLKNHLDNDEKIILQITKESKDALDEMVQITNHVLLFLRKIKPTIIYDLKKYHPQVWKLIENQHFPFIENVIKNNLIRGQSESLYRKDANPDIISKLYVVKSLNIVDEDRFPLTEYNRTDLLMQMILYHLNGIVSDEGKTKLNLIKFKPN